MPWKCPACSTPIRHLPLEDAPRPQVIYRCSVCRLELVLDESSNRLDVVPLSDPAQAPRRQRSSGSAD